MTTGRRRSAGDHGGRDGHGGWLSRARRGAFRSRLDAAAEDLRDLPWRRTRDPWAILVAETMLQQTQVTRVVPRWEAFLRTWPDAASCAAASRADVIAAWDGLGYNRRAVNLHRAAHLIADRHDGVVPSGIEALGDLPGVGPYTARAVAVFAFERCAAVVDANVARVLARAVVGETLGRRDLQAVADELVPAATPWRHNQAIMEVGAVTCRKRSPDCAACVLADLCAWRAGGGGDPAQATAGVANRQSEFAGSDRQGRGRLVAALRRGPVARGEVAEIVDWDDAARVTRMVAGVVDDGLAVRDGDMLRLPA